LPARHQEDFGTPVSARNNQYEIHGGSPMRLSPRRGQSIEANRISPLKRSIHNEDLR
jgi:hypothetical protein